MHFHSSLLSSVECYNPQDNVWEELSPMCKGKTGAAVAGHKGKLFVVGGYADLGNKTSGDPILNDVECYDPAKQRYHKKVKMLPKKQKN